MLVASTPLNWDVKKSNLGVLYCVVLVVLCYVMLCYVGVQLAKLLRHELFHVLNAFSGDLENSLGLAHKHS